MFGLDNYIAIDTLKVYYAAIAQTMFMPTGRLYLLSIVGTYIYYTVYKQSHTHQCAITYYALPTTQTFRKLLSFSSFKIKLIT